MHHWDPRCKLLGLLLVTIFSLSEDPVLLAALSLSLTAAMALSVLPPAVLLRPLVSWLWFLGILFAFQAFSLSEEAPRLIARLPVTTDSLTRAAITGWRLVLILLFGILFTAVTKPTDLKESLIRLLRPLPFLPKRRIAVMVALTLRLFTILLDLVHEVRLANRARLGDRARSPLRRIQSLVLPVLRRALIRADAMAIALAARGYREDLPTEPVPLAVVDWLPLVLYTSFLSGLWCWRSAIF